MPVEIISLDLIVHWRNNVINHSTITFSLRDKTRNDLLETLCFHATYADFIGIISKWKRKGNIPKKLWSKFSQKNEKSFKLIENELTRSVKN